MFEFVEPIGILKKFVRHYCIVETNNPVDFMPYDRVFPNGNITMVFHYASPSKFKQRNGMEYTEPDMVICGQQHNYYDLSLAGKTGMIFIVFKTHGAQSFFNFPILEISNQNLSMHDIAKDESRELADKMYLSKSNQQRIIHLENFLLKRLQVYKDFSRMEEAVKIIEQSKGQIRTRALAQEVCLGIKQFERIFSNHVGLNPKKYISIVRFQQVLQMSKKQANTDLCQLAFDNGYYDQSHFIHDFKRITDVAPREFFSDKD